MTQAEAELAYYSTPGPVTAIPDEHAKLLVGLPHDVASLCAVVQGVVVHPHLTGLYGVDPPPPRRDEEPELRSVAQMLARIEALDSRPLVYARPPDERMLGTCRSFATLLCALLRHHGVPARSRCGFARYFVPSRGEDHWVCEAWCSSDCRWMLVDAQLDAVQVEAFRISLDPLDIDRDQFLPGGLVWQQCRRRQAAWSEFGLSAIGESGVWFVLGDFVRDVAALNKLELLPWDDWGLMLEGDGEDRYAMTADEVLCLLSPDDLAQLDRIAEQTGSHVALNAVRLAHDTDARFRVPPRITCGGPRGARSVDVSDLLGASTAS